MTILLSVAVSLACGAGVALAWARQRLLVVTVQGPSMEPTLRDGDRIVARRRSRAAVRTGQLVVIERPPPWLTLDSWSEGRLVGPEGFWQKADKRPGPHWIIKRVAAVGGEALPEPLAALSAHLGAVVPPQHFVVLGDNADRSVDSRRFGYLTADAILGVVARPKPRRR